MKEKTKRKLASYVGWGFLLGTASGFLVAVVQCGPDLFRRLSWAAGGCMGETAAWDEPLFYLIVSACIYGTVGAILGTVLGAITAWIARYRTRV
jgi:hypothetical protein